MNDTFQRRLGAAVGAAWWTVLVWWLLLLASWCGSMAVMHIRPAWVLGMLGEGVTWLDVQMMYLWLIGSFKVMGIVAALVALFLTLWHRRLGRLTGM